MISKNNITLSKMLMVDYAREGDMNFEIYELIPIAFEKIIIFFKSLS